MQNVFLLYHYQELLFLCGYHTTKTENSVPFLGLRGKNTAATQVEGQWHFLTVSPSVIVLTHIFALHHHGMQVTQERSAPEKGLQDYRSPKSGDGDVPLHFFLSCSPLVSQSCKTQSLWPQFSEVQRHGLTEVAQVLQGKSMIRLLWFQVRIPPSGFALPSQE